MNNVLSSCSNYIYLFDAIDEEISKKIIRNIIKKSRFGEMALFINSPGGSVIDALAIYDVIRFYSENIITVGVGVVASMASLLLASANKGRRFLFKNTTIQIHLPFGVTEVGEEKNKEMIMEELRLTEILSNLLDIHSSGKLVLDNIEKENLIVDAKSAIDEYGLADYII